jgi:hypothetical protein
MSDCGNDPFYEIVELGSLNNNEYYMFLLTVLSSCMLQQEELHRLQKASKLALEAQQLMLKETHDIAEIHKSFQQVG